jgi:hypothetical protein
LNSRGRPTPFASDRITAKRIAKPISKVTSSEAHEAEAEAAEGIARMVARRKAGNGLPPSMLPPTTPFVAKARALPVNGALSSLELLAEIDKQMELVRTILGDAADEPNAAQACSSNEQADKI